MTAKYFLICIFLCAIFLETKADSTFTVADSLFDCRNFQDAQIEYERIVFETNITTDRQVALYKRASCFKQLKEFSKAIQTISRISYFNLPDTLKKRFHYEYSLLSYLAGSFQDASFLISNIDTLNLPKAIQPNYFLLKSLVLNELRLWNDAQISATRYFQILGLNKLDSLNDLYQHQPKLRSIKTAKILQVLPGAGMVYAGKPWEGFFNFSLNAAFLGFGVYNAANGLFFTGYFIGGIGLNKFYFGGQNRTEFLVNKYNYQVSKDYNNALKLLITSK
jgi:hypothetical protein